MSPAENEKRQAVNKIISSKNKLLKNFSIMIILYNYLSEKLQFLQLTI